MDRPTTLSLVEAYPDFIDELIAEIEGRKAKVIQARGGFFLCEVPSDVLASDWIWAKWVWTHVQRIQIESIGDGAKKLRALAPRWYYLASDQHHRRGTLIAQSVPRLAKKEIPHLTPIAFPTLIDPEPYSAFTIWEPNLLLASQEFSTRVPGGIFTWQENRQAPPSRAYLKLWEALTRLGRWPQKGERVVDLGSAPGSWTWVLLECGARVLSVDRTRLSPDLMQREGLTFLEGDAFAVDPLDAQKSHGPIEWVFSDLIAFPTRIYELALKWMQSGVAKNLVFTIKFKGKPEPDWIEKFARIPRSKLIHLEQNKHELTWMWSAQSPE